jgi:hypothetical protein
MTAQQIETAPIEPGETFGPCLLYVPDETDHGLTNWWVGAYDGECWYTFAGDLIVTPTHWAKLPETPATGNAAGPPAPTS